MNLQHVQDWSAVMIWSAHKHRKSGAVSNVEHIFRSSLLRIGGNPLIIDRKAFKEGGREWVGDEQPH